MIILYRDNLSFNFIKVKNFKNRICNEIDKINDIGIVHIIL